MRMRAEPHSVSFLHCTLPPKVGRTAIFVCLPAVTPQNFLRGARELKPNTQTPECQTWMLHRAVACLPACGRPAEVPGGGRAREPGPNTLEP